MYRSCCPSKVSVLTIGKPEHFDLNCSSALMRPLDSCAVYPLRKPPAFIPCLPYRAQGWDKAASCSSVRVAAEDACPVGAFSL